MTSNNPRIIIIGAGPTGLGAAYYLRKIRYNNWFIYEKDNHAGGLSSSIIDNNGFTWDHGGHVIFSHYKFFDEIIEFSCKKNILSHNRYAFAYMFDRLVPYPVQNNIRYLPDAVILDCLFGLIDRKYETKPENFKQWIDSVFGKGLAEYFMLPYNRKVWSTNPEEMGFGWIGERVSVIDIKHVLKNIILKQDDNGWGPNSKFVFPEKGGTQAIFSQIASLVKDNISFKSELYKIDIKNRKVFFKSGKSDKYDYLISSVPVDEFVNYLDGNNNMDTIKETAGNLVYNKVMVTGIGIKRKNKPDRSWIYFPEQKFPWYRVTYFSNYSPYNVPSDEYFSLMGEISYPAHSQPDGETDIMKSIESFEKCAFILNNDISRIESFYSKLIPKAYPVPTLERDKILNEVQSFLMSNNILSRGRFGGWKYEVANMDHSVMQGKEAVDYILFNKSEETYKLT